MESAFENRSENNLTMTWKVYWLVGSVELGKKLLRRPMPPIGAGGAQY
jgi:hypothetical protein